MCSIQVWHIINNTSYRIEGSILGSLLFITFMNDLPLTITFTTDMYADYSFVHTKEKTVVELTNLNHDMVKMKC